MTQDGLRRREALAAIGAAPLLLAAEARAGPKLGVRREDHVPVDGARLYLLVRGAPVIFMLGRYDRVTDSRLAAAYFERLAAPRKRLLWFEHSAHNPPFEEPMAFDEGLADALREVGAIDGAR